MAARNHLHASVLDGGVVERGPDCDERIAIKLPLGSRVLVIGQMRTTTGRAPQMKSGPVIRSPAGIDADVAPGAVFGYDRAM
ncbi:MAG TPA: hypothetical protein VFJ58_01235 [Armatimonadota bacterium]|nr:hypothetical protein [Armatimonadota bacterium]